MRVVDGGLGVVVGEFSGRGGSVCSGGWMKICGGGGVKVSGGGSDARGGEVRPFQ